MEDKMKIIVGYDRSRVAGDALRLALNHAEAFEAIKLVLNNL